MGALTSTIKRGDDHPLYPHDPIRDRIQSYKSKKNRSSLMSRNSDRPMSSRSSFSTNNQYPDTMSHYSDRPLSSKPMIYQYRDVMSRHYTDLPMPSESSSFMTNQYSDFMSHDSDRPMPSQSLGSMFSQDPDFMSHNSDMSSQSSVSMINQNPDFMSHNADKPMSSQSSVSMINQNPHFMSHNLVRLMSSKSSVSIINRYPHDIPPLKREVHAPCRQMKKPSGHRSTWSSLKQCYDCINHLRSTVKKKGKEVINVDLEKNVRVEDPGIEESPTVSDHTFADNNVNVINVEDWDVKELEFINVDSEKNVRVEDPGIEEIATVSGHGFADNNVDVINVEELEEKALVGPRLQSSIYPRLNEEELDAETSNCKNMEYMEKLFYSLNLNPNVELDAVPEHEKMITCAEKVYSDLSSLKSEIHLDEKRLLDPVNKPAKVVPQEPYVPLTKDEKNKVSSALSSANRRKVLATHRNSNIEITGEILQCLKPRAWLNDEVINVYMELLKEREQRDPGKFLQCHFFNTFFYKKLVSDADGYDFKSVRRWTTQRKLGYSLVDCDKIFIPVHKAMHWCLAVINKKDEKFQYLDSLGGTDFEVFRNLARYFTDEVKDKTGKDIDVSSWQQEFVENLPAQKNGWDCGMFMIKYADFYSRGVGLYFDQGNMKYFRLRTVNEILNLEAN